MLISRGGFHAFTDYDLRSTLENILQGTQREIESDSSVSSADEEEYVRTKVEAHTVPTLELDTGNITITQREEMISARYFPGNFFVEQGEEYSKPVITFHLPFKGDQTLLRCRPSTWVMNSEEIDVHNGNILFEVINFSNNADEVGKARDSVVGHLTQQIENVNRDIAAHNARLETAVRGFFHTAKKKFQDEGDFLSQLGNKPRQ